MRDGWREVSLGEVAQVNPREPALQEDAPFVPMEAIEPGRRWVTGSQIRGTRSGARFRGGDVLFARITPCLENGKVAQYPPELGRAGGSTELIVLRAKDELDPSFLYQWATSRDTRERTTQLMVGSTGRQRLAASDLAALPFVLPPIQEQRRIADLLETLDSLRAAAIVETAAAATFATRLRARLLASPEIDRVRLADVVEVTMGRQRSPKHQAGDHLVPYLRAANIKDGVLALDDVLRMNFTPKEQTKFRLKAGDVLITEGCGSLSQIGANAVWRDQVPETVCFQNTVLRLRAVEGQTIDRFVAHWARHAFDSGAFAATSSGTSIFHIGAERAAEMLFPSMTLGQQELIVRLLDEAENATRLARAQVESLGSMRAALLSALLSGEREIPGSYDRFLPELAA